MWLHAASHLPTQLSQTLQCEVRGGRNILQVKQYFNLTICPLIITSRVLGGGRYVELLVLSEDGRRGRRGMFKPGARSASLGGGGEGGVGVRRAGSHCCFEGTREAA